MKKNMKINRSVFSEMAKNLKPNEIFSVMTTLNNMYAYADVEEEIKKLTFAQKMYLSMLVACDDNLIKSYFKHTNKSVSIYFC